MDAIELGAFNAVKVDDATDLLLAQFSQLVGDALQDFEILVGCFPIRESGGIDDGELPERPIHLLPECVSPTRLSGLLGGRLAEMCFMT